MIQGFDYFTNLLFAYVYKYQVNLSKARKFGTIVLQEDMKNTLQGVESTTECLYARLFYLAQTTNGYAHEWDKMHKGILCFRKTPVHAGSQAIADFVSQLARASSKS